MCFFNDIRIARAKLQPFVNLFASGATGQPRLVPRVLFKEHALLHEHAGLNSTFL